MKGEVLASDSLKDRCLIIKIGVLPSSYVDSFPVMTKDFDVFNPYD